MPKRNEVSCYVMISRYIQNGFHEEALTLFSRMIRDGIKLIIFCLLSIISVLSAVKALQAGMNVHAHVLKTGVDAYVYISSALIGLYCKCGNTRARRLVFDSVASKDEFYWNSMISGYNLNGQMEEAEKLFQIAPTRGNITWNSIISGYMEIGQFVEVSEVMNRMLLSGEVLSEMTFSSVLSACSRTASLKKGKNSHGKAIKLGFVGDVRVGTVLN
ncbi:pentatricopeptide repeat-containing protein At2g22070-like [Punica granatum]|uniref:Pentatricopeptide repeat-containing protein At2g22070-like n=2 Tax=Punica granatum TaxID=22663 RepID=A0A6P8EJF8_PUNGR|nr:pentatricopeptide repeat-containing protein At2g22070-like [Punica granatum]PKI55188.1 hypothetical protein CRG98_024479 [Punica granatum]